MSVTSKMIKCDWLDCDQEFLLLSNGNLSDYNWEYRNGGHWHACPTHRFRTTAEFIAMKNTRGFIHKLITFIKEEKLADLNDVRNFIEREELGEESVRYILNTLTQSEYLTVNSSNQIWS